MAKQPDRVAIQGIPGAFHEIAAMEYFTDPIRVVSCETFADVIDSVERGQADFAIMAIENSVAGSILPNYALLRNSNMKVVGEVYLRIAQNLLALPGETIESIREVYSHPMAIAQSRRFFDVHPHIRLVESSDTASSAKRIAEEKLPNVGAIASLRSADLYGLNVIAPEIETNKRNYTRFLIMTYKDFARPDPNSDKSSICFSLPHEPGALSRALSILAFYGMDLTKIQSLPIIGREWQYLFYVDVVYSDPIRYRQALSALRPLTEIFEIQGEYRQGRTSFEEVHHQEQEEDIRTETAVR